ncbi:hypothetical protein C8J55DRAFT_488852 [Lentinula edodes]|uniref:Uncharacterized protein n=1 Tax=Lentinula lateritia TaxID=40482 RepID=A0A9W9AH94_9AGAR|nr:hypothetical protein C8J55DRAFT_488852 [Lentinula edodes]
MLKLARAFDPSLDTVTGSLVFLRKLCRFGLVGGIHEVIWAQLRSFNSANAIAKYYQDYVLDGAAVALIDHREEDGRRRCSMQKQEWVVQGEEKQPKSAKREENDMGWRIGLSDDGSEYDEAKDTGEPGLGGGVGLSIPLDGVLRSNERGGDDLELGPDLSDILLERAGGNGNGPKVATSGDTARGGGDSGRENIDSEDAIERMI